MGLCPSHTPEAVVQELKSVALLVRELIFKYEKQYESNEVALREAVASRNKNHQLIALRKRKTLEFYITRASKRLHAITDKQYAIEQLGITKMHLDAMKHTSSVFKIFAKKNSVEKVEKLCDSLSDLTDQVLDVEELINTTEHFEIDEFALEEELRQIELEDLPVPPKFIARSKECPVEAV